MDTKFSIFKCHNVLIKWLTAAFEEQYEDRYLPKTISEAIEEILIILPGKFLSIKFFANTLEHAKTAFKFVIYYTIQSSIDVLMEDFAIAICISVIYKYIDIT